MITILTQTGEIIQRDSNGEFVTYEFLTKEDDITIEKQQIKIFAESNRFALVFIDNDGNKQAVIDSVGRAGFTEVTAKELKIVNISGKASIITSDATEPRTFKFPDVNINMTEMFTGQVVAGQTMEVVNGLIKTVI